MKPGPAPAGFDIPIGALTFTVPDRRMKVPGLLWESLAWAAELEHDGYEALAIDELAKISAWLKRPAPELDEVDRAATRAALLHWFGIQAHRCRSPEVAVLMQLETRQTPISPDDLAVMVSSTRSAVHSAVCRLRAMMDAEAIDSIPGEGYALTEVGRAEYHRAIQAMHDALADQLRRELLEDFRL